MIVFDLRDRSSFDHALSTRSGRADARWEVAGAFSALGIPLSIEELMMLPEWVDGIAARFGGGGCAVSGLCGDRVVAGRNVVGANVDAKTARVIGGGVRELADSGSAALRTDAVELRSVQGRSAPRGIRREPRPAHVFQRERATATSTRFVWQTCARHQRERRPQGRYRQQRRNQAADDDLDADERGEAAMARR
jgi:hypothetical protein